MRIALDTSILAYAEGIGDEARCNAAIELIGTLPAQHVVVPAQTLGELYRVLTSKANRDPFAARAAILGWADSFDVVDSTWSAFQSAMDVAVDHQLQIWDALILSVAGDNRCRVLLSEDMQENFTWRGVTVVNPFSKTPHPLLATLLP